MKKLLLTTLALFSLVASAQQVSDGFYRVQNYGTKRYAYIYDNTGGVNYTNTTADMGAISLIRTPERRFSDPASIIHIAGKGKNGNYNLYDLEAQGTGVYKIINYYVSVYQGGAPGTYFVYEPTYNMYLCDPIISTYYDESYISTTGGNPNSKLWSIYPVSAGSDEYLGIAPDASLKAGGKFYKPYYLGFSINLASSGMKAYYVSDVKSDAVIISELNGPIPAETPVIVECTTQEATNNRVELSYNKLTPIANNKLKGNYFCFADHGPTAYRLYNGTTMRLLTVKDGKLCYATDPTHKHTTELEIDDEKDFYINANESYLEVPAGFPESLPVMTQAEYDATHSKKGDINGDGKVDAVDVAYIYRAIAAGTTATEAPQYDIDGDGKIDAIDVAMVYRIIAKES